MSTSVARPPTVPPAAEPAAAERRPAQLDALAVVTLLLTVAGLAVALYLTYIHYSHAQPICTPGGGCEAVNSSSYATVGPVPVALLGAGMYATLFALTVTTRLSERRAALALLARFGVALAGVGYSAYLTTIALAVIRATCIWCLVSFSIVLVLLLVSLWELLRPPGMASPA